ncbi:glycosyltransferase [Neisseria perflava]|uniref:glycosyltransferase n=1 Tax=Neisseria perflava TaxID=33053 RepID=UPI00209E5ED0|nr:glycosyltransferase [Neisseria perflava]MCP1659498.1 glycosyltransferase involved in cell wall biosynthesis [Neisseria perflava]MCP1772550.1 glycosyltransferase involved in cell wall biosynthesis [Neisseria perflava]
MHVVVIPSWYPTSEQDTNGQFFRAQAQALQRQGLKVGVIAPLFRSLRTEPYSILKGSYGRKRHTQGGLLTYTHDSMYFFPRCPIVDIDRIRWVKVGMRIFKRYIEENGRPDIIHAHAVNYGGILAYQIFKKYGIPYVITEHSSTYARNLVRPNQWPAMIEAVKHSAARFAVSHDFCTLLRQKYHGQEWLYLPNILGRNFSKPFTPVAKNPHFTFCSVAFLRRLKGYDILLPAFAQALQKYPDLKLEIGGDGLEADALKQLAADLNITHAVTFLGSLTSDEVLALMRRSHAFVLASRTETFGVVYIEAMSQGLPVIATRCGGPESFVNEQNGLLVPVDDVAALADALIELYEHNNRFSAQKLRQDCLNEFGEEAVISRLIQTFESIVQKN